MPITSDEFKAIIAGASENPFQVHLKAKQAQEQAQEQSKLESLLKGQLAQQQQAQQMKSLQDLQQANPNAQSIHAGDFSVSTGSKMGDLIDLMRFKALEEDRQNRQVERLGKASVAAKIPEMTQFAQEAENTLTPERIQNAYGGFLGGAAELPVVGGIAKRIQEVRDPEAGRTRAVMEQLKSFPRHELFGATLTGQERTAADLALGGGLMKRPEMVQYAVSALKKMVEQKNKAVSGSFPKAARERYKQEMGQVGSPSPVTTTPEKTVVKKERSPSTGKVRITYSDGTQEIQ